ncbi:hypothetical protein L1987_72016 [Smallanthus sonchifolius]|uniref:Uncharacterized protein n=1 Tax=Smallanthus sonchifolius TaxID=185202 RepID=A0ACB9AUW2_9ASTR|nr:hypothetical protein L1987_72016 [Smallanthus sonchifolius]
MGENFAGLPTQMGGYLLVVVFSPPLLSVFLRKICWVEVRAESLRVNLRDWEIDGMMGIGIRLFTHLVKKVDDSREPEPASCQNGDLDMVEASDNTEAEVEDEKEISPEWWGNKFGFVSGGLLGAQSKRKKCLTSQSCNKRTAFHEDDQENLYKLVQDKATSGKQGLGIKGRPRKVAGVHFQGKKTSFSDSEREESESEPKPEPKGDNISESENHKESKLKLKKLCRKLLCQEPEKSLKLKQLMALVDEHYQIFSNFSSEKRALAFLKNKLERSSKFIIEGKRVRLSSK